MNTVDAGGAGRLRRIMLALDALNCEMELIEAAVRIAAKLDAELDALFVEDDDVFAVAALPITREISLSSAREREISGQGVEQALRCLSREAEQRFADITRRRRVKGRFQVMRARREQAIGDAALQVGLLLLQPRERALVRVRVREGIPSRVMVLCGQTPATRSALEIGLRLARDDHHVLEVIVAGELETASRQDLEASGLRIVVRAFPTTSSLLEMLAVVDDRPGNTLLVPGDLYHVADRAVVLDRLSRLHCQTLLVN